MRVALIGPVYPYRGGIALFTASLASELELAGHSVSVFSFIRQYPAWLYPGKTDKDPSARHAEVKAAFLLDPLYFWTWIQAARAIEAFQPDIVVFQWWTTFWSPAYFSLVSALGRKIPCVFCIHNVMPHEKRFFDVWAARQVLSRGKACITLSPQEGGRLLSILPKVRHYPARLSVYDSNHQMMDTGAARQILGLPPDQPILLFFGLVRKYKGLEVLLDALGLLKAQGLTPLLLVSGEFWGDIHPYQARIRELGIEQQVVIDNRYIPDEELPALFSAADGFVAPHIGGSQSGATKLAMTYGLPVMASQVIARDLPVGRYPVDVHETGNAASLARSIEAFLAREKKSKSPLYSSSDWEQLTAILRQICEGEEG